MVFSYNALNLLGQVKENNAVKANYQYLADGTKLCVRNGNGNTGYDYDGSFVYTVTNGTPTLEAAHFAEGQLKADGVSYSLTDHLGSVRAQVGADGSTQQQNDYYPFGSQHVNTAYASSDNRYTFSGKERQELLDLNTYDFGARMYDADLGRWNAVDPLCEIHYPQSLYNYCGVQPVNNIDPDGNDWYRINEGGRWKYIWDINVYSQTSLDKIVKGGEYLGITYIDNENGTYYSLTGQIHELNSFKGQMVLRMDQAIMNHLFTKNSYVDFDLGVYFYRSVFGLLEGRRYYSFPYEGGLAVFYVHAKGTDNKATFGGFKSAVINKSEGNTSRGQVSLPDGVTLKFERKDSKERAAAIIFKDANSARKFQQKCETIRANHRKK